MNKIFLKDSILIENLRFSKAPQIRRKLPVSKRREQALGAQGERGTVGRSLGCGFCRKEWARQHEQA